MPRLPANRTLVVKWVQGMEEDSEPKQKRRRLALACDRCRQRKIKCDAEQPCGPCVHAKQQCVLSGPSAVSPHIKASQSWLQNVGPASVDDDAEERAAALNGARSLHSLHNGQTAVMRGPTRVTGDGVQIEDMPTNESTDSHPRINENGLLHLHGDRAPKFLGSSSSQVFIKWFDQEHPRAKLAAHFGHAAESVEEVQFESNERVDLPPAIQDTKTYVDAFFRKVHVSYPVVDRGTLDLYLDASIEPEGSDRLIMCLAVILGADASTGTRAPSKLGDQLFQSAWRSLPSLLAAVNRQSAQALILLSLACRARNKDGAAWYLCGYAVRICHGLGMHLRQDTDTNHLNARIWFTLYTMDKLQSCSAGRPSAIRESDCTISETVLENDDSLLGLVALVRLCRIIADIQSKLFSAGKATISTIEALARIGRSDEELADWVNSLPAPYRLASEPAPHDQSFVWAVQISIAYNMTLILLHRLSLFDDLKLVQPTLEHPQVKPYASRLLMSASICASSARSILTTFDELVRYDRSSRLITQDPITLALFVLTIYTYRNPSTWQARADLSLLEVACKTSVSDFEASGFHSDFYALLPKLFRMVEARVLALPSAPATRQASPVQHETAGEPATEDTIALDFDAVYSGPALGEQHVSIEDLWSSIFGPGVSWTGPGQ